MNNINQVTNNNNVTIVPTKQNTNFKATQTVKIDDNYDAFIKEQEKAKKNAKKQQRLNTGIQIGVLGALLSSVAISVWMVIGKDTLALKKMINKCKNPILKDLAKAEFQKGPQMRSEKKIKEILELANQSKQVHGEVDLKRAKEILDEKIIGMDEVKEKILTFLGNWNYDIIHGIKHKKPLVFNINGPAGTGKTTIAEVIAEAIGIPFKKVPMGGSTGASIIRGTESKFVGSEAGAIAKGQIENKTNRVLYLLDEIDKLGKSEQHGTAENALLSMFDDQGKFLDDFLGAELDLSNSIFITTTNDFQKLSGPLKNRIESIEIKPYTNETKAKIAKMRLNQGLEEYKLKDYIEKIEENTYDTIAKLTRDDGGRETTRNVQEIIKQIKLILYFKEIKPTEKITIDKTSVEKWLNFNNKQSMASRIK